MTGAKKVFGWASLLAGGIVLVGLGVFFAVTRLDDADKWGSVVGALVALLGLPMTVYAFVIARRSAPEGNKPGERAVDSAS